MRKGEERDKLNEVKHDEVEEKEERECDPKKISVVSKV